MGLHTKDNLQRQAFPLRQKWECSGQIAINGRNDVFAKYSGIFIDYENWKFIKDKAKL